MAVGGAGGKVVMCQALLQLVVFVHKRGATRIGHTVCVCVETEKLGKGKRPIDVSTSPRLLRQAEAACEAAHATAEAGCHPTIAFAIAATRRAAHGHVYYMWDSVWRVPVADNVARFAPPSFAALRRPPRLRPMCLIVSYSVEVADN